MKTYNKVSTITYNDERNVMVSKVQILEHSELVGPDDDGGSDWKIQFRAYLSKDKWLEIIQFTGGEESVTVEFTKTQWQALLGFLKEVT